MTDLLARLEVAEAGLAMKALVRSLTKAQRLLVTDGCVHGDFSMHTVRALKRKGLFHLVIDSPNGQCGFMRLTDLGVAVQAILRAKGAEQ